MLVSIPAFGAILIQCWKVEKATGLRFDASRRFFVRCERLEAVARDAANAAPDDKGAALDAATLRVDRLATLYLSVGLGPLVIGYAVKTLVYDAHLGWYASGVALRPTRPSTHVAFDPRGLRPTWTRPSTHVAWPVLPL